MNKSFIMNTYENVLTDGRFQRRTIVEHCPRTDAKWDSIPNKMHSVDFYFLRSHKRHRPLQPFFKENKNYSLLKH